MALLPVLTLGLKAFTAFWALLTWIVAAALIGSTNDRFGSYAGANFSSANALLACALLAMIYLLVSLFFIFRLADNIFISVMVDIIFYGFFFIFALGATASLSTGASFFSDCNLTLCSLGSASIGLGWILTFLLLGILLLEVIYTLTHYGGSLDTWRTPFAQLLHYGTSTKGGAGAANTRSGDVPPPVALGTLQSPEYGNTQQPQMQQNTAYSPVVTGGEQQGYAQSGAGSTAPGQQGYPAQQTGHQAV